MFLISAPGTCTHRFVLVFLTLPRPADAGFS